MISVPYPVVKRDKQSSASTVFLKGVTVESVTKDDIYDSYAALNMALPTDPAMTKMQHIVYFFIYVCIHSFHSNEAINKFCKKHRLGFIAFEHLLVSQNIIMFRHFLNAAIPIKMTVVDGQHRVVAIHHVQENRLLSNLSPSMALKKEPSMTIPYNNDPLDGISEMYCTV